MPKFQKEFPKNARSFFSPQADEEYKKAHPIGYGLLVACGIGMLVLPLIVLLLVTLVLFPAHVNGFLFLAFIGCFIIGIGNFNIVAAWIGQYLGHWLTIGSYLLGGVLTAISLFIMYVPEIYTRLDEEMVSYYFGSLLFLMLPPIFYGVFRLSVDSWLKRKKVSNTRIKKLKKGKRNYWWYEALHAQFNLGLLYRLNKWFTILYPVTLGLSLFLGWVRFMSPVISGLYCIMALLLAAMSLFSSVQDHLDEYGTPIVLLRRSKRKSLDSIVFDILIAAFPLGIAYVYILGAIWLLS